MAIIQCPGCGEQISSLSKSCVHCGCSFQICPECGTALNTTKTQCTKCGFEFSLSGKTLLTKVEQKINIEEGKEQENKIESYRSPFVNAWKKTSFFARHSKKIELLISILVKIVAAISLVIIGAKCYEWLLIVIAEKWTTNEEAFKIYMDTPNLIKEAKNGCILVSVMLMGISGTVNDLFEQIRKNSFCDWLTGNNLNGYKDLKKDIKNSLDSSFIVEASYLQKYPSVRKIEWTRVIASIIFRLFCGLFLGIFFANFCESAMTDLAMDTRLAFNTIPFKSLIAPIVIAVVWWISTSVFDHYIYNPIEKN